MPTQDLPVSCGTTARHEARMLLPLLRLPRESIESVRALITLSPAEERELRRDEAHAEAIIEFRRKCLAAFDKLIAVPPKTERVHIGQGGRVPPELRQKIRLALLSGCRPRKIVDATGVTYCTVLAVRRELGLGRFNTKKLDAEQIAQATQLLAGGQTWPRVAAQFSVGITTLRRRILFRKRKGVTNVAIRT
jgi:hypothetical protein